MVEKLTHFVLEDSVKEFAVSSAIVAAFVVAGEASISFAAASVVVAEDCILEVVHLELLVDRVVCSLVEVRLELLVGQVVSIAVVAIVGVELVFVASAAS